MKHVLLMHGANLNALGKRDPIQYGHLTLTDLEALTRASVNCYGLELLTFQSNHEGCLIDTLQQTASTCLGIIINPGAFSHYSYALHDALIDTQLPVIEVHLSAIDQREAWRAHSVTAPACLTMISGKKHQGYLDAVHTLMTHLSIQSHVLPSSIDETLK